MQNRFVPNPLAPVQTIYFPTAITAPDDITYAIQSDPFFYNGKVCTLKNKLESTVLQVIEIATGLPIVDNVGTYSQTDGIIDLVNFTGTLISGSYFRITAVPANPSVINPLRNNILRYDNQASRARAILTDTV